MNEADISRLVTKLTPDEYGWHVEIPSEHGVFVDLPVTLDFETQPIPEHDPPPAINDEERSLARIVLGALETVLKEAERQFLEYHRAIKMDPKEHIESVRIWINRDAMEEAGPKRWTFVVGGPGDFGTHLEFDELKCVDVWAGD